MTDTREGREINMRRFTASGLPSGFRMERRQAATHAWHATCDALDDAIHGLGLSML